MSIYSFFSIFLKRFIWFTWNLIYKLIWSYFCRCVKDRPQRVKCFGHFRPSNESKFRIPTILSKNVLWIHVSLALYTHWSYFQRCVQYVHQRPNFWAFFGPEECQNSGLWSFSQKIFFSFISVLLHMLIASTLKKWRVWASEAQFFRP